MKARKQAAGAVGICTMHPSLTSTAQPPAAAPAPLPPPPALKLGPLASVPPSGEPPKGERLAAAVVEDSAPAVAGRCTRLMESERFSMEAAAVLLAGERSVEGTRRAGGCRACRNELPPSPPPPPLPLVALRGLPVSLVGAAVVLQRHKNV